MVNIHIKKKALNFFKALKIIKIIKIKNEKRFTL